MPTTAYLCQKTQWEIVETFWFQILIRSQQVSGSSAELLNNDADSSDRPGQHESKAFRCQALQQGIAGMGSLAAQIPSLWMPPQFALEDGESVKTPLRRIASRDVGHAQEP